MWQDLNTLPLARVHYESGRWQKLDWTGLDRIGPDWTGPDRIGPDQ